MKTSFNRAAWFAAALALAVPACSDDNSITTEPDGGGTGADAGGLTGLAQVKTIVVIYAENRSFDNIYGTFPGANGIPGVNPTAVGSYIPQTDRDSANTVLSKLPQTWGGVTAPGQTPVVTQAMSDDLQNKPFPIETTFPGVDGSVITRDLYHRFFENQMQINGGANDKFAAFADAGGLVMGYYDGSHSAMWQVAKDNVLADNFFMGAFGGSFLNHQYLICGCAPEFPNADTDPAKPPLAALDKDTAGKLLPRLTIDTVKTMPSAIDNAVAFVGSTAVVPKEYFGDGKFHAVNTMQPPYQPSSNLPATDDATKLFADRSKNNTLPPQSATTVGDQLDAKSVTWAWYAGGYTSTLAITTTTHVFPDGSTAPGAVPNYQFHHHPFNFFAKFDPMTGAAARTTHFKDGAALVTDAAAGTLPQVTFYKPEGDLNQHPGYASITAGDAHIADLVTKLKASPQYANMVIIITYDENGGFWDHVAPPKGDLLGPSNRIPAIIVSPFGKKGTVDHTQYDTGSILRLIQHKFGLDPLPGITARDAALQANGKPAMGDLTGALNL